jgi:hypothetical protein
MDSSQKETLDFDIVSRPDIGYAIRLRGSIFEGIEYRYTVFQYEDKPLEGKLYFDYEIIKNPNGVPRTDELHNFVSFIAERLVRSGLVKVANETNRNSNFGKSAI